MAMALGAMVGYDREASDKPAGLRTHMLVAGAGAIIAQTYNSVISGARIQADPIRVFEAIIRHQLFGHRHDHSSSRERQG